MGLLMDLPKECNAVDHDFPMAYWSVESVSFASDGPDSSVMVSFLLQAYPDRDSKVRTASFAQAASFRDFGEPIGRTVDARLYRWAALLPAAMVFTGGIPLSRASQLAVLYPFVKQYLGLMDAVDVLEEE